MFRRRKPDPYADLRCLGWVPVEECGVYGWVLPQRPDRWRTAEEAREFSRQAVMAMAGLSPEALAEFIESAGRLVAFGSPEQHRDPVGKALDLERRVREALAELKGGE